jgi:uncharacterized protein (DUF4415 family)
MTGNKPSTAQDLVSDLDPDDAPDLSAPQWREQFDRAPVRRGRPPLESPKILTTIRLDADVLEAFRSQGPGWQTRVNEALREWLQSREK